jgi:hypothetical protein
MSADDKQELERLKRVEEVFDALRDATEDICVPRYHYFCPADEAQLPDKFVVTASVRPVLIYDGFKPDDERENTPCAPLCLEIGKDGKQTGRLVRNDDPSANLWLQNWQKKFEEDLQEGSAAAKNNPCANFLCFPDLQEQTNTNASRGPKAGLNQIDGWIRINALSVLDGKFVCFGSAHRHYIKDSPARKAGKVNDSSIFPQGNDWVYNDDHVSPKKIFDAKLENIKISRIGDDVVQAVGLEPTEGGSTQSLTVKFKIENMPAFNNNSIENLRFWGRKNRGSKTAEYEYAKQAFQYFDSMHVPDSHHQFVLKQSPARKIGEHIDSHGLFDLNIYVTNQGVVSVLICYDAYDPDIILSAIRLNLDKEGRKSKFMHPKVDMFFVPSFNPSPKLVKMCQLLSREAGAIVVYLNSHPAVGVDQKFFVFSDGVDLASLCSEADDAYVRKLIYSHEDLRGFEIRSGALQQTQHGNLASVGGADLVEKLDDKIVLGTE